VWSPVLGTLEKRFPFWKFHKGGPHFEEKGGGPLGFQLKNGVGFLLKQSGLGNVPHYFKDSPRGTEDFDLRVASTPGVSLLGLIILFSFLNQGLLGRPARCPNMSQLWGKKEVLFVRLVHSECPSNGGFDSGTHLFLSGFFRHCCLFSDDFPRGGGLTRLSIVGKKSLFRTGEGKIHQGFSSREGSVPKLLGLSANLFVNPFGVFVGWETGGGKSFKNLWGK